MERVRSADENTSADTSRGNHQSHDNETAMVTVDKPQVESSHRAGETQMNSAHTRVLSPSASPRVLSPPSSTQGNHDDHKGGRGDEHFAVKNLLFNETSAENQYHPNHNQARTTTSSSASSSHQQQHSRFVSNAKRIVAVNILSRTGFVIEKRRTSLTTNRTYRIEDGEDGGSGKEKETDKNIDSSKKRLLPPRAAQRVSSPGAHNIHHHHHNPSQHHPETKQPQSSIVAGGTNGSSSNCNNATATTDPTIITTRVNITQLQWRNALNQRPATCERNLRDLEGYRSEVRAEQQRANMIVDEEAIHRRRLLESAYEQFDLISERHQRTMRYLLRLQLNEQVKKATVDKQNEKIHGLFVHAVADEKKARERRREEEIAQRLERAAKDKELTLKKRQAIADREAAEQREKQEAMIAEREQAKQQRQAARFAFLAKRRENVQKLHAEKEKLLQKTAVKQHEEAIKHKQMAQSSKDKGLPIHSFLRLPPLRQQQRRHNNQQEGGEEEGAERSRSLSATPEGGMRRGVVDDDESGGLLLFSANDEDKSYTHTSIVSALAQLEKIDRRIEKIKMAEKTSDAAQITTSSYNNPTTRLSVLSDEDLERFGFSSPSKKIDHENAGGEEAAAERDARWAAGTQTDADWLENMSFSSSSSSDEAERDGVGDDLNY